MEYGFILGNGESRKSFDLNRLTGRGPIYGCNALYRDFSPTVLFSRDTPMLQEIRENYKGEVSTFLKPYIYYNKVKVKIPHELVLAGSVALWCMCSEYLNTSLSTIYLLGFDPFPSKGSVDSKNNIYKGTINYGTSSEPAQPRANQCIQDLNFILSHFSDMFSIMFVNNVFPKGLIGCDFINYFDFDRLLESTN